MTSNLVFILSVFLVGLSALISSFLCLVSCWCRRGSQTAQHIQHPASHKGNDLFIYFYFYNAVSPSGAPDEAAAQQPPENHLEHGTCQAAAFKQNLLTEDRLWLFLKSSFQI